MPQPLKAGMTSWHHTMFGKGPGFDTGAPIWQVSHLIPSQSSVLSLFAQAELYDVTVFVNIAGSTPRWTHTVNGKFIFDQTLFETEVRKWTVAGGASAAVADCLTTAFASRRFVAYVIDEPFHTKFGGSITRQMVNNLCLLFKSIWPGVITAVRAPSNLLSQGVPAGGWTGLDYGWSQYGAERINGVAETPAAYFARQRAEFATLDLGMIPGLNWLNVRDPTTWDVDQNGATPNSVVWGDDSDTPGKIGGTPTPSYYLCYPQLIRDTADAIWNDADAPAFNIWRTLDNSDTAKGSRGTFLPYELRSDFVAAFDYMINKFNTRPTWNGWRTAKGTTPPPPPPTPDIEYGYTEVTTRQTSGSTAYVDIPGASIPSTEFVAGRQYLLYITADVDYSYTSGNAFIQTLHGATAFGRSEMSFTPANTAQRENYHFMTVWTAVAAEGIKLQYKGETAGRTIGADQITLFALDLSSFAAADFKTNLNSVSTALGAGYSDGASVTFTPATAGHDWLILTCAQYDTPSITQSVKSRINVSGGLTLTEPEAQYEGRDAVQDRLILTNARVDNLAAVAHTYKEQSANTGGGGPRVSSEVFCIDLHKFAAHGFAYAASVKDYDTWTPDPFVTQAQTAQIDLTADSPVWCFAAHNVVIGTGGGKSAKSRMQVDNIDAPLTQTADNYRHIFSDGGEARSIVHQTVVTLADAVHTVDLDASLESPAAGRGGRGRLVVAVQLGTSVAANLPPVWDAVEDQVINEGSELTFVVSATDPEAAALTYSTVGTLPAGAQFDPATRRFVWTPSDTQAGLYVIAFRVTDGTSTVDMNVNIAVADVPTIITEKDLRTLRYDHSLQGTRFPLTVRWNGGSLDATRQGVVGIVVIMSDMGRI